MLVDVLFLYQCIFCVAGLRFAIGVTWLLLLCYLLALFCLLLPGCYTMSNMVAISALLWASYQ